MSQERVKEKKWNNCNAQHPCRHCQRKKGMCGISSDGSRSICRHVEGPGSERKADKNNNPFFYYRHDLNGHTKQDEANPKGSNAPPPRRATPEVTHEVYVALLAHPWLRLSSQHLADLARRGIPEDDARRRGYASMPANRREEIAGSLIGSEGFSKDDLLGVPGFFVNDRGELSISSYSGLLIPIRDHLGRIVALCVRPDKPPADGGKYFWVSSSKRGGLSPGAPIHVPIQAGRPIGADQRATTVRLTEGALKGDATHAMTGEPVIGIPGVTIYQGCPAVLRSLGADVARLALDADWRVNDKVARSLLDCVRMLEAEGLCVEIETWDPALGKGIDDLLASGGTPDVLSDEAVDSFLQEVEAVAFPEGRPTSKNGRMNGNGADVDDVADRMRGIEARIDMHVSSGGASAIMKDVRLLEDIARLRHDSAAAYGAIKANMRSAKIAGYSAREFEKGVDEHAPKRGGGKVDRSGGGPAEAGPYYIEEGRFWTYGEDGTVPLSMFTAKIIEEIVEDDGVEEARTFVIEATLANGQVACAEVGAREFAKMDWIIPTFGPSAIVEATKGTKDHVRAAIQYFSGDRKVTRRYLQTGWRDIDGEKGYLSRSGAIKAAGLDRSVCVELPGLGDYELPGPPSGARLLEVVRATLKLLELARTGRPMAKGVGSTLFAAPFRAVLGFANLTVQAFGLTGSLKTSAGLLSQQFFGARMNLRNGPPATWKSTPGYNERLMFMISDAILLIDDFVPRGSTQDISRIHAEASRVLQSQGNGRSRDRLNSDGSLQPSRPPRGLLISTGEDRLRPGSADSRSIALPFVKNNSRTEVLGTIDENVLSRCQRDADAGVYAEAMAGYLQWLAPRIDEIRSKMPSEIVEKRAIATRTGDHGRTPDMIADLYICAFKFLGFAREIGAITDIEFERDRTLVWDGLMEAGGEANRPEADADAGETFVRLIVAGLSSRQYFLENSEGIAPKGMEAVCGWIEDWKYESIGQRLYWVHGPNAVRLGWTDCVNVFFEPSLAYKAVQDMARSQAEGFPVGRDMLFKLLYDGKKIVEVDSRKDKMRYTTRKTHQKKQLSVLMMSCADFWPDAKEEPGVIPDILKREIA